MFTMFYREFICLGYNKKKEGLDMTWGFMNMVNKTFFEKCSWRQYADLMIQRNGKQCYFIIEGHGKLYIYF